MSPYGITREQWDKYTFGHIFVFINKIYSRYKAVIHKRHCTCIAALLGNDLRQTLSAERDINTLSRGKMAKNAFFTVNVTNVIKISLEFVLKCPIKNSPALVQIMVRRRLDDKPLSEPMTIWSPTRVTRLQRVKCRKDIPYTALKGGL